MNPQLNNLIPSNAVDLPMSILMSLVRARVDEHKAAHGGWGDDPAVLEAAEQDAVRLANQIGAGLDVDAGLLETLERGAARILATAHTPTHSGDRIRRLLSEEDLIELRALGVKGILRKVAGQS